MRDINFHVKRIEEILNERDKILADTYKSLKAQNKKINEEVKAIKLLNEKARIEKERKEIRGIENMTYAELKSILIDTRTDTQTLEAVFEKMQTNSLTAISNQAKGKLYRILYENPNISEKILCGLSIIAGPRLKSEMAVNPNMPAGALKNLYLESEREYKFKILYLNPNVPKEFITEMAEGNIEMNINWFLNSCNVSDEDVMKYVKYLCSESNSWNEYELIQIILKRHVSDEMSKLIESTDYERAKKALFDLQKNKF